MNDKSLGTHIPVLIDGFFDRRLPSTYCSWVVSKISRKARTPNNVHLLPPLNKVQRPRRTPRQIPSAVMVGVHKALHDVRRRVRREPGGDVRREEVGGVCGVRLAERQEVEEEARYQERGRTVVARTSQRCGR